MSEKLNKKYCIEFTNCDPQYQDCRVFRESYKQTLDLCDKMVYAISKQQFSLMGELNTMQGEALYGGNNYTGETDEKSCFNNKYDIPLYFVNLLLKPYNLKICIAEQRS